MSNFTLGKDLMIAVVDDHGPFRTATCRLLELRGFGACSFGSVAEFISSSSIHRVDCLLLDVRMPDLDGFALQDCLRDTNYDFPIIFCTGQDDEEARKRALARGAVCFLHKPLNADALVEAIRKALAEAPPRRRGKSLKSTSAAPFSSGRSQS